MGCSPFFLLASFSFLAWAAPSQTPDALSKTVMNSSEKRNVFVEIGEPPEAWVRRYGKKVEINSKNHGLKFYGLDWTVKNPGQLIVRNRLSEFQLEAVLGAMGTFDDEYPGEGFSKIVITTNISQSETIAHDEARQKIFALLQKIRSAGWTRWIYPSDPRLSGEDAFRYQIAEDDTFYSLDSNYLPPLDVWMKLSDRSQWKFFLNDVAMSVRFSRDQDRMKPNLPGAYIVWIELISKNEMERSEFQGEERKKWKALYPGARKRQLSIRIEQEKKLQMQGYKIDVEYKNPDQ
ncbi:hypothetical protein FB547_1063 [Variovorax beijingensis]|uniref:Uncharacterized protein n=1 Tax=Variovorax beijingensis TaxID=2496117 RepID=A0A561C167_9BURK|nr:hypothetical protein FB547_1063 [Variovorax beijingensis]